MEWHTRSLRTKGEIQCIRDILEARDFSSGEQVSASRQIRQGGRIPIHAPVPKILFLRHMKQGAAPEPPARVYRLSRENRESMILTSAP
uniref:Uncharacterized protein n=1 Tax=Candidatus Kentrum sp. SD TaxID=2126332 RepID=A0A450Z610_9GAMM|nr:MAG: hypothetical protein BECKSD772F_GA0070984_107812 [Candidatus Kentron sp. SD]VFK49250.1 MAG: hypothetical protein BECKSD772E_GA0070983_11675 [Candidatus Kentron sp. SD]